MLMMMKNLTILSFLGGKRVTASDADGVKYLQMFVITIIIVIIIIAIVIIIIIVMITCASVRSPRRREGGKGCVHNIFASSPSPSPSLSSSYYFHRHNIFASSSSLSPSLGKDGPTKTDEFLEKFQTAFAPPLIFGKSCCAFRDKSAYVQYGGTVVYYMILFPMRCM